MCEILYLVVPCYNEEKVIRETAKRLLFKLQEMIENKIISKNSKIVFVNDGSSDNTWNIIKELHFNNDIYCGINLSRNRGHQNALLAGLLTIKEYADIVISLDADLQDDIEIINEFVKKYYEGNDIVYGVRESRECDSFFKKTTALAFYKFMNLIGVESICNHADYRLLSKRVLNELANFKEVNLFLRGLIPLIGFKWTTVKYKRHERFAGESKYPLCKMLYLALDGITSLSVKPIRMISAVGFMIFCISICVFIYTIIVKLLGKTVSGWTSLAISIWILGGIQLLSLGVIGEYIGKIYSETKQRPRFIIMDKLLTENNK